MIKINGSNRVVKRIVYNAFNAMRFDAKREGYDFYISSAYRSYATQKSIYEKAVKNEGSEFAERQVAKPGCSEHHTGLAIDITNNDIVEGKYKKFNHTPEYSWIINNCYKYGFIERYKKGKEKITGYDWEPWHFRYVGVDAATIIHEKNIVLEEFLDKGINNLL